MNRKEDERLKAEVGKGGEEVDQEGRNRFKKEGVGKGGRGDRVLPHFVAVVSVFMMESRSPLIKI
jgi:hypothetical protein